MLSLRLLKSAHHCERNIHAYHKNTLTYLFGICFPGHRLARLEELVQQYRPTRTAHIFCKKEQSMFKQK